MIEKAGLDRFIASLLGKEITPSDLEAIEKVFELAKAARKLDDAGQLDRAMDAFFGSHPEQADMLRKFVEELGDLDQYKYLFD